MNKGVLTLALILSVAWSATAEAQRKGPTPPKIEYLPDIQLPEGHTFGDLKSIKLPVVIDARGVGTIQRCKLDAMLCDLAALAISSAEFKPAMRNGKPVRSRVNVVIRLKGPGIEPEPDEPGPEEPVEPGAEPAPTSPRLPLPPATTDEVIESGLTFSAFAEVETRTHTPIELEVETLRNIPGALGEPFRALEVLPGVTPLVNGQPFVYVRGAPPAGTVYVYDDIPIPALFHAAIGPSVLHPSLIGDLHIYNGAPPARYGRLTGGAYVGEGPSDLQLDRVHGSLEVRAIDSTGLVSIPVGKDGSVTSAGRIGYANALLNAFNVDASLKYWNYQHREDIPFGRRGRFQLVAFGAKDDSALDESSPGERFFLNIHFHRVEVRTIVETGRWQLGTAFLYGFDETEVRDESLSVPQITGRLHRLGPRVWASYANKNVRVRLGADFARIFGRPNCDQRFEITTVPTPCDAEFASINRRSIGGAYLETEFEPAHWVSLGFGVRSDVWSTGGNREVGVDPRARVTFHANDDIDIFAAYALTHQPAVFSVPLPGFGDIGLEPGLQDAHQIESGLRFRLPYDVLIEAKAFVNIYRDLRFLDFFTERTVCDSQACGDLAELEDNGDGRSVGAEFWVSRNFAQGFSGLFSYTLAFSDLEAFARFDPTGLGTQTFDLTPTYDVRHVFNVAAMWRAPFGLILGARVSARSGRAEGWAYFDPAAGQVVQYLQRLPWFYRLDLQVGYERMPRWGRIRVSLEWVNVTRRADVDDLDFESGPSQCNLRSAAPTAPCNLSYTAAVWIPNLSFRLDF